MKKNLILLIFTLIFFQSTIQASEWEEISLPDENSNTSAYIDIKSIKNDDSFVYYKAIYRQHLFWLKTDCQNKKTAILNTDSYNYKTEKSLLDYKNNDVIWVSDNTSFLNIYRNRVCSPNNTANTNKVTTNIVINKPADDKKTNDPRPDWHSYMRDLEKRIKEQWSYKPDHSVGSKVVVTFLLDKSGKLLFYKITDNKDADEKMINSAIKALKAAFPVLPLPVEYKGEYIPIEFTFQCNINFGSGYSFYNPKRQRSLNDGHDVIIAD